MVSPLAFAVHAIARRSAWSLLFEVLPVWLLAAQSLVAVSSRGDVDGRSNTPLFSRPIGALRKGMGLRGANDKITHFLGRWTIQERHNIDEFLEGAQKNKIKRQHAEQRPLSLSRRRIAHAVCVFLACPLFAQPSASTRGSVLSSLTRASRTR